MGIFRWVMLSLALICTGCGMSAGYIDFSASVPESEAVGGEPLRIAFSPVMSPQTTRASYQKMADYIGIQLGRPAVILQRRGAEEVDHLVADGGADVAFLSTGAYTSYRADLGEEPIELLVLVETGDTLFYRTEILVAADSDIASFEELRGRSFAFVDPRSFSGKIAVTEKLAARGETPETYFSRVFYTHHHDRSIWAVANHIADGASVDSQIYDFLAVKNPQLIARVRVLADIAEAPTGPVVVRSALPAEEKARLREIFYQMAEDPEMQQVLRDVAIDRFVPPDDELYAPLIEANRLKGREGGRAS